MNEVGRFSRALIVKFSKLRQNFRNDKCLTNVNNRKITKTSDMGKAIIIIKRKSLSFF